MNLNLHKKRFSIDNDLLSHYFDRPQATRIKKRLSKFLSKTKIDGLTKKSINIFCNSLKDPFLSLQLGMLIRNKKSSNLKVYLTFLNEGFTKEVISFLKESEQTFVLSDEIKDFKIYHADINFNSTNFLLDKKDLFILLENEVSTSFLDENCNITITPLYSIFELIFDSENNLSSQDETNDFRIYWEIDGIGKVFKSFHKLDSSKSFPEMFKQVKIPKKVISANLVKANLRNLSIDNTSKKKEYAFLYSTQPEDIKPYMLHVYLNQGGKGNGVMKAIASSMGADCSYAEDFKDETEGIPFVWGILRNTKNIIDRAIENNQYFYYVDHAYFGRGHGRNYRISRNAYEAGPIRECPSDRLEKLSIKLDNWSKSGSKIIICPPTEYFQEAHKTHGWLENTLKIISSRTDREIIVRRKPKAGENIIPLRDQLKEAYALVTHSSNVAIESVVSGVPVFVSPTSAAASVGQTDLNYIESPKYPDREPWLRHLAYCQFSFDEIKNGDFFEIMKMHEKFSFLD